MQAKDSHLTGPKPPTKRYASRYAVSVVVLLVIVGALAWLAQYLPTVEKKSSPSSKASVKKLLDFPLYRAQWGKPRQQDSPDPAEIVFKECEFNSKGYYDFLFKNVADEDVEILYYLKDCDCTTLHASVLPKEEWDRLSKLQQEKPGEALTFAQEPAWTTLFGMARQSKEVPAKEQMVQVKAGETGVVRVSWVAKKAPGQELNLSPIVLFQPVGDATRRDYMPLLVPVKVRPPLEFSPTRASAGILTPGTTGKVEFRAWSSTRAALDLDLVTMPNAPLFAVKVRKLSKAECAEVEQQLAAANIGTRVLSACAVTVTVHESNAAGQRIDQGTFYQKFHVKLDGQLEPDLLGPEVTGRVKGDIDIGGTNDQGKVRFPPFDAKHGASKSIYLSVDEKIQLEKHTHKPDWVDVILKRETKEASDGRHLWQLEVKVKAGTPDAHSFDDRHAVVLRLVGPPERFVRIPLEGQITGGR